MGPSNCEEFSTVRRALRIVVLIVLLGAQPAQAAEIVTLVTRPNVSQSYLLMYDKAASPKAVALLFTGGGGEIKLPQDGTLPSFGRREFSRAQPRLDPRSRTGAGPARCAFGPARGMQDAFRMDADHATDVAAVVRDLRQRFSGAVADCARIAAYADGDWTSTDQV